MVELKRPVLRILSELIIMTLEILYTKISNKRYLFSNPL